MSVYFVLCLLVFTYGHIDIKDKIKQTNMNWYRAPEITR